jgi:biopolymer transport protein ExbD
VERGIIFLLGGVAAVGLAIFALVATGSLSVDVGSARPASLGDIGTVLQRIHTVDIAANGALKVDGKPSSLAALPADLDRVAGKHGKDDQTIDVFADPGVSPERIEQVRGAIYVSGWRDVSLSYQTGKIMKNAGAQPVPAPPHTATSTSAP